MTLFTAADGGHPSTTSEAESQVAGVDIAKLEAELHTALAGEVRFTAGDRALYATDSSNYRQTPMGVVMPRDAGDVMAATEIC